MKLKLVGGIVIVIILMVAFSGGFSRSRSNSQPSRPTESPTAAWYDGGTLHDKTAADWLDATPANRLAAACAVLMGWEPK